MRHGYQHRFQSNASNNLQDIRSPRLPAFCLFVYHIYGKVYGNNIECLSPLFEVVDYGYDFSTSQLKMIGETTIIMKKDNNYILYEGLQRPAFEFDFMTEDGSPSNEIDQKNTIISASLINSNNEPKELDTIWIDVNKLLWVLKV